MEDQKDGFPLHGAVQTSKDGFLLMVLERVCVPEGRGMVRSLGASS